MEGDGHTPAMQLIPVLSSIWFSTRKSSCLQESVNPQVPQRSQDIDGSEYLPSQHVDPLSTHRNLALELDL